MKARHAARPTTLLLIFLLLAMTAGNAMAKDDEHGYLGVMLQNVTNSMAKALQLDDGQGVLINKVVDDGPAAAAGLEDGDVILKFNGKSINKYKDLTKAVRATAPGDKADLEILHNGKRQTAHVVMGETKGNSFTYSFNSDSESDAPAVEFLGEGKGHGNVWIDNDGGERKVIVIDGDSDNFSWTGDDDAMKKIRIELLGMDEDRGFMGVELDDLNEQLGEYFGVADGEGALISNVNEDSPAAKAGFKAGDVIITVNGEEIDGSGDVHQAMSDTEPAQEIEVKIVRKGKKKTIKVTLGEMPEGSSASHAMHFDQNFDFPEGFDHDVRVMAPHGMPGMHGRHKMMIRENDEDLSEVREELDQLREELKKLKSELKK